MPIQVASLFWNKTPVYKLETQIVSNRIKENACCVPVLTKLFGIRFLVNLWDKKYA